MCLRSNSAYLCGALLERSFWNNIQDLLPQIHNVLSSAFTAIFVVHEYTLVQA